MSQTQKIISRNHVKLIALVGVSSMFEFWDAYLIGFIMAFLIKSWGLTFGIMGTVLLASGIGAIIGGLTWGAIADKYGRKPAFVACLLLTGLASIGLAFTPDGNWLYLAALRVVIGFGTGAYFINVGLVQEFMPAQRRGLLVGIVAAMTTGGLLMGALSGAFVIPNIGWRATFALGGVPAVMGGIAAFMLPESPRWLMLQGRPEDARKAILWALPPGAPVVLPVVSATRRSANLWGIFRYRRQVVGTFLINIGLVSGYYGLVLWGPTLISQIERVPPAKASLIMIGFSVAGIASRLLGAYLVDRVGRRAIGALYGLGSAIALCVAGFVGHGELGEVSLFWLPLLLGFILADGSFAICVLYSTEIWPSRLRGNGAGFANASGNIGKILGPLGLALIAGSHNVVLPTATVKVILPAFLFLAASMFICGISYLFFGIEVRGRSLEALDEELDGDGWNEDAANNLGAHKANQVV